MLSKTQEVTLLEMSQYMAIICYYPVIDKATLLYDDSTKKSINVGTFKKLLKDNMITMTFEGENDDDVVVQYYDLSTEGNEFCKGFR